MKKLFISIIAMVSALTMSAQTTADVTLRLESQSGSVSELYLFAGPDLAASPERGSFMKNESNPEDINIFAIDPVNNNRYGSFGNEALVNIPVGIITSKEAAALQNYTLHFEVYENDEVLKLKDLVTGTETTIADGGSYAFTIAAATDPSFVEGSYSVIADRFVINYVSYPAQVKTNAYGLATFSYVENLVAVEAGVKLYKGAVSGDVLGLTQVDYVAAGQGVIVYGEANTIYHFNDGNGTSDFAGNELKPATAWAGQGYVLSGNLLYVYEGADFPANKAFLEIPSSGAPARIRMVFDNATAIDNVEVEAVNAEKFIEDGQLFIRRGNEVFNLQGQIVK